MVVFPTTNPVGGAYLDFNLNPRMTRTGLDSFKDTCKTVNYASPPDHGQ